LDIDSKDISPKELLSKPLKNQPKQKEYFCTANVYTGEYWRKKNDDCV